MSKESHHFFKRGQNTALRHRGPVNQDDGQTQPSRRVNLGARTVAAGILGNDALNAVIGQQRQIILVAERPARHDHGAVCQRQQDLRLIDKAQQIMVLRLGCEGLKVQPSDGKEDAAARTGKRFNSGLHVGHCGPGVARFRHPGRTLEGAERYARELCCFDRIGADLCREGMGGIDQMGDGICSHPVGQPLRPAKAADPRFDRLRARRVNATRIGQYGIHPNICAGARQEAGFARSAQNEDTAHG